MVLGTTASTGSVLEGAERIYRIGGRLLYGNSTAPLTGAPMG